MFKSVLVHTIEVKAVQVCNSHEVMCCFYEWLPSSVSALTVTSSLMAYFLLCCLVFLSMHFSVSQMFVCFCFIWPFLLSKHKSSLLANTFQYYLHVLSPFLKTFLYKGNILLQFSDAYIRALYYHLSILYLFLLLYISLSVFSVLCLKQRKQWTWCLIMQISSGLISLHNSIHNLINELANNIVAFLARVIKRPRKFWAHFVNSKW